ncbi:MAG: hypothetical protein GY714_18115 [Desulfobacterales bacterium]|nr:hypothetical protein [Desulfobacterales bacterium]
MAQQRYVGQDIGGFGRLADMKLRLRGEARADQAAEMRSQLSNIQLQQARSNMEELGRRKQIQSGLTALNQNLPEGENSFTASYKYLMENDPKMANDYMNSQSERIEQIYKMDTQAGADAFNDTIGRVMNTTVSPVPGKDDLVKATDTSTGRQSYLQKTAKGFVPYSMPEGMTIEESEGIEPIPDAKLEYWARQKIATGKKIFNVRGKKANEINRQIEEKVAEIQLAEGVTGEETAYLQEDRKAIQKSIAAQEKQRGSMTSFVENLGKQIDHVATVAKNIKTMDTRLFNMPVRFVKRKFIGSPELSKYEVYLGEIQSEIGKLSSGSTASVSELSEGARVKWEGILDENLSIEDMLEVLEEVKEAGFIRLESVDEGLRESRSRLRDIGGGGTLKDKLTKPVDYDTATDEELFKILKGK